MNSHILSLASGLDALAIGDTKGVSPFCLLGPKSAKKITGFTECKTAFLLGAGACKLLHDTVSALESANLTQFEALVSDTACHNRAVFICLIYKRFLQDQAFRQECFAVKDLAGKSIKALQEYAAMVDSDSAKRQCNSFIGMSVQMACQKAGQKASQEACQTSVTSDLITLARCVLLCQIRNIVAATFECAHCNKHILAFQEQTNSAQASLFFSAASKACLSDIVSAAKEAVAKQTVELVIGETLPLQPTLSGILKKGIRQINNRDEIPCFYAIMALYTIAQRHNLAFLVKVKKQEHLIEESPDSPFDVQYLYKPTKDGFVKSLQTAEDEGKPVIVIEGMRSGKTVQVESLISYEKRLSEVPLLQLLQLNSAQHPQYSDKSFVIPGLEPQEVTSLQQLTLQAKQIGCSNVNESLFCITHIFADTLKKELGACSSSSSVNTSSANSSNANTSNGDSA